jgi:hypothetical protein
MVVFAFCFLVCCVDAFECYFGVCMFEKIGNFPNFGAMVRKFPIISKKAGTFVQQLAVLEQSPWVTDFLFVFLPVNIFASKPSLGYKEKCLAVPPRKNLGNTELFKPKLALTILPIKHQLM